jgi:DNA-directed RNA polymerase specialized sigma subunit
MALRQSFQHQLSKNLPEPLTKERGYALFTPVRAGNETAKQELILGCSRLVMSIVAQKLRLGSFYTFRNPNGQEELVAEAMQQLVIAVERIEKGHIDKNPNPVGFIVGCVNWGLEHFRRKFVNGVTYVPIVKGSVRVNLDYSDLKDFIATKLTDQERQVLELKGHGCTDLEIGHQMLLTKARICQIRNKVTDRLKDKFQ